MVLDCHAFDGKTSEQQQERTDPARVRRPEHAFIGWVLLGPKKGHVTQGFGFWRNETLIFGEERRYTYKPLI